jgi:hypothetical protein
MQQTDKMIALQPGIGVGALPGGRQACAQAGVGTPAEERGAAK